jgi:hypothetical protein
VDAILAAGNKGPASTVKATGYPGPSGQVVFQEGTLSVPSGVTVSTDESPLTTDHYVIKSAASVTSGPFISLSSGATLSGFEVSNTGATGDAITTNCPTIADTPLVTIDTVNVNGTGASPAKFKTGIHHGGICSLSVNNTTITGVGDTGIVLDGGGPAVSLTNNVIKGNDATRQYTFPGPIVRQGGGIVVSSSVPSSVVFHGNQVYGNKGDQILVAVGSGTLDLRGGTSIGDCGVTSNVIRCYDIVAGGKGVYAAAMPLEVMADFNEWWTTFPGAPDVSGNVTGIGSWCPVQSRPACP